MSPSGPRSKLIYHGDTIYKGQIGSKFTIVQKDVLVITQSYVGDNEQGLWIVLVD